MEIKFTRHALKRLVERKITLKQVSITLKNPDIKTEEEENLIAVYKEDMKLTYDPYADALYIYTNGQKRKAKRTEQVRPDLLVDFGLKDELLGIEILDVSAKIPKLSLKTVNFELSTEKPKPLLSV